MTERMDDSFQIQCQFAPAEIAKFPYRRLEQSAGILPLPAYDTEPTSHSFSLSIDLERLAEAADVAAAAEALNESDRMPYESLRKELGLA